VLPAVLMPAPRRDRPAGAPALAVLLTLAAGCGEPEPLEAYFAGDHERAVALWQARAEGGDPEAQNYLGVMYQLGQGVPRDPARAFHWYRQAALAGNPDAQRNLGNLYQAGRGVEQDNLMAYGWYHFASLQGNRIAKNYIVAMTGELTPNQIMQAREIVGRQLDAHADAGAR